MFMAYEGQVFRWLTFRAGARKPIYSTLTDEIYTGEKAEVKDSPFEFSVGTGFHFGNFHVDAVVQQEWMFTGGPIAGDNETTPFTRLSGTYRF